MNVPEAIPNFRDIPGVAEALGVSREWVRARLAAREIPYYKLGRSVRISDVDLLAYLEKARSAQAGGRR